MGDGGGGGGGGGEPGGPGNIGGVGTGIGPIGGVTGPDGGGPVGGGPVDPGERPQPLPSPIMQPGPQHTLPNFQINPQQVMTDINLYGMWGSANTMPQMRPMMNPFAMQQEFSWPGYFGGSK